MSTFEAEVSAGERFQFGSNWSRFLGGLDETKISDSTKHISAFLDVDDLNGKTFLDVGSGSGLTSLGARRLGAKVTSFDFDPQSVACTTELRRKYTTGADWAVSEGSALDRTFLSTLGQFDVVCSWGVLHHTGAMWAALENMTPLVKDGGLLYLAIYNDQGGWSRRWLAIKKIYNKLPGPLAKAFAMAVMLPRELRIAAPALLRFRLKQYLDAYRGEGARGMSRYYDMIDWVGGYPFEVAKPEEIFDFYRQRGFALEKMRTCGGGLGCNQFVFRRIVETRSG